MARSYPEGVEAATVARRSVRTKFGRRSTDSSLGLPETNTVEDMKRFATEVRKGLQALEKKLNKFERDHELASH